jgi:heme exporter protein B
VSTGSSAVSAVGGIQAVIVRDLRIALRRKSDTTAALFFFLIVASLFPIGVGPDPQLLRVIAPGIVWVAALLASMLSLSRLFADDYNDGTLEQLLLSAHPLALLVFGKMVAHWLTSGLLLSIIAPLLALQFDLSTRATFVLVITLLLGTPLLSLIGTIGAALTVGVRGASVLVSLLVLPLYVPVLIFGVGAIDASNAGVSSSAQLSLLAAMLLAGLFLSPLAAAAALRISLE